MVWPVKPEAASSSLVTSAIKFKGLDEISKPFLLVKNQFPTTIPTTDGWKNILRAIANAEI